MRTKALLGLAALAVGLSTAVAQNVYSLNVVGYVNVTLQAGKLHFLSLPLAPVDGNYNVTNTIVLDDTQDGATLFNWAGTTWNADPPIWYAGFGWANTAGTPTIVSNGVGFFLSSKAGSTLTFVGQVPQGTIAYNIPTGLSTLANQVPVSTNFPGLNVGHDGNTMLTWGQTAQTWTSDPWVYYAGSGWFTSTGGDGTGAPLNPAEAVFYINSGAAIPFTQNFTVQ